MSEQEAPLSMGPQVHGGQRSLWEQASGWRNLTIAASFLTLAAVSLPMLLPPPESVTSAQQSVFAKHFASSASTMPVSPITPPSIASAAPSRIASPPTHTAPVIPRAASAQPENSAETVSAAHKTAARPTSHPAAPVEHATAPQPSQIASLPAQSVPTTGTANGAPAQTGANPSTVPAPAAADLPVGTIIVSPGVLARVNRHNRYGDGHDWPISITIISPPAHGTVTTQDGTAPVTYSNGVTRISSVTQVFYQSAPGYTGMDTFTYKRTSEDPSDPRNANTYTMTIDVK